jgi:aconitate hydratase
MVKLYEDGIYLRGGSEVVPAAEAAERGITQTPEDAKRGTIAYSILQAHNTSGDPEALKIRFDAMASHDITFVGIIQTARASGMEQFPLPYVLTNCHNSLCAVGGTINEDDHVFGLSAAKKYGGIFVPPHIAVIHSFMRENFAGCGKMILGSDSHTRYGALGTIAVGEGGGELAKQLLRDTYGSKLKVFASDIPQSVRAAEISAEGKSIYAHDPNGKVAAAYRELTKEVMKVEKLRQKHKSDLAR